MAVDKLKVIARLKALFPKANLSQKRLDALADKLAIKPADDADDVAIDAVINDFNSVLSIEDIAREDDRVRTLESKVNPPAPVPAPAPKPTDPPANPNPSDDVNQKLLEAITKLTGEVESIKTGKVIETKRATASELFGKSEVLKGIPETIRKNWENRIDVNSETPFEDQIQALEKEYSELVQVNANSNQYAPPAGGGSATIQADQSVIDKMLEGI